MQDSYIERFDAWQTPIFTSAFPQHEQFAPIWQQTIANLVAKQQHNIDSEVAVGAKQSLYESGFDLLQSQQSLAPLHEFIEEAILFAAYEANQHSWPAELEAKVTITESWYHLTEHGGYHDGHTHPNCSWCAIYCLEPGQTNLATHNGVNRFYDPRAQANQYDDLGSQYIAQESYWDIALAAGQLVVFPAYLRHAALPYFGDTARVVIACNAQLHASAA